MKYLVIVDTWDGEKCYFCDTLKQATALYDKNRHAEILDMSGAVSIKNK